MTDLRLFSLKRRRLKGNLNNTYKFKSGYKEDRARLFPLMRNYKTRGNEHKQEHHMFHTNMRKNFSTLRVTEHWKRQPREVVESPLEILKTCLDALLCHLL